MSDLSSPDDYNKDAVRFDLANSALWRLWLIIYGGACAIKDHILNTVFKPCIWDNAYKNIIIIWCKNVYFKSKNHTSCKLPVLMHIFFLVSPIFSVNFKESGHMPCSLFASVVLCWLQWLLSRNPRYLELNLIKANELCTLATNTQGHLATFHHISMAWTLEF